MATTMNNKHNSNNSAFNKFPSAVKKPMTADINLKRRKFHYVPRSGNNDNEQESRLVSPRTNDYDTYGEPIIEDININEMN